MIHLDDVTGTGVEQDIELLIGPLEADAGVVAQFARDQNLFLVADHVDGHPGGATAIGKAALAANLLAIAAFAEAQGVMGMGLASAGGRIAPSSSA